MEKKLDQALLNLLLKVTEKKALFYLFFLAKLKKV